MSSLLGHKAQKQLESLVNFQADICKKLASVEPELLGAALNTKSIPSNLDYHDILNTVLEEVSQDQVYLEHLYFKTLKDKVTSSMDLDEAFTGIILCMQRGNYALSQELVSFVTKRYSRDLDNVKQIEALRSLLEKQQSHAAKSLPKTYVYDQKTMRVTKELILN
jgi:hypothetical protein